MSAKGKIIGGVIIGVLAIGGYRYCRRKKKDPHGAPGHPPVAGPPQQKGRPKDLKWHSKDHSLAEEGRQAYDEFKKDTVTSFDKLRHDAEYKARDFNDKMVFTAEEYKRGAEDRMRAFQKEANQLMERYKHQTENAYRDFQRQIDERATGIGRNARGMSDEVQRGFSDLKKQTEEGAHQMKNDMQDFYERGKRIVTDGPRPHD